MSEPKIPSCRAGLIPVEQGDGANTTCDLSMNSAAHKSYRGSACPSSCPASTAADSCASFSSPDTVLQPPIQFRSRLSRCTPLIIPGKEVNRETSSDDDDDDDETNSSTVSSASSSSNSSKSSTHEEETRQQQYDAQAHNMLPLRNFGSSSSSASSSNGSLATAAASDEPPVLPPRSARRTSRLLSPMPPKKTGSHEQPMLPHAAPHQAYLSSEEDASSSADDFSDFDGFESDAASSRKSAERHFGREDTARVVSVVFHGKPSMITLSPTRRSMSPSSSSDVAQQNGAGILRAVTEPTLNRQRSDSSASCLSPLQHGTPRSASMVCAAAADEKKRPTFLQIDPYAKVNENHQATGSLWNPKTPTTMFRKTLSLVKKRSKPNLNQSESQITPMEQVGEVMNEDEEEDPRESLCLEPATPSTALTYEEIIQNVKRNMPSPRSPKNRFRTGLSLSRQRSVKI